MERFDLHMHTTYCDGNNTAEEMVLAAIDRGLDTVGISGHSFTPHDPSYCMSKEGTQQYIRDILELRQKYSGQISVLLGLERDYYTDPDMDFGPFDYMIGSLHYMFKDRDYTDVDYEPYRLKAFADKHFGGDMMCLAELYYETVADIAAVTDCDIIGHFDLITKFNERFRLDEHGEVVDLKNDDLAGRDSLAPLFDTEDPRYVVAWKKAVDKIFEDSKSHKNRLFETDGKPVFEINTGAIARGYRTFPYPAQDQIDYIRSRGGLFIINSDSHSNANVCYKFEEFMDLL